MCNSLLFRRGERVPVRQTLAIGVDILFGRGELFRGTGYSLSLL
ncbi:hypothetical protein [Geobacter sp. DSM 9736]|nr:hypothetical protein [Geobacter sp. DSM 9736]